MIYRSLVVTAVAGFASAGYANPSGATIGASAIGGRDTKPDSDNGRNLARRYRRSWGIQRFRSSAVAIGKRTEILEPPLRSHAARLRGAQ